MKKFDTLLSRTALPATVDSIATDLAALGVEPGMIIIVHASLSSFGWVCGGALAVILGLQKALGSEGTLVMPTQSSILTDPSGWRHPPVPEEWWETIRRSMPAYDPATTPTGGMGRIPELFRTMPGVVRSAHPHTSFAAWGRHAEEITREHPLPFGLGDRSPLARIYELGGWVLLIGVDHGSSTSIHLAEYRCATNCLATVRTAAPVSVDGERRWVEFEDLDIDDDDFPSIGADFEQDTGLVRHGRVALADARLMPQRPLVDYAAEWMSR